MHIDLTDNQRNILFDRIMLERLACDGSAMDLWHFGKIAVFGELLNNGIDAIYLELAKETAADYGWTMTEGDNGNDD